MSAQRRAIFRALRLTPSFSTTPKAIVGGVADSPDVGCARNPADFTRNDVAIGVTTDS